MWKTARSLQFPIGVLFVTGSLCLLFWNEGNYVRSQKALDDASATVVALPSTDHVDADYEEMLVYVAGQVVAESTIADAAFGVIASSDALKLQRSVEMLQWEETEIKSQNTIITYVYTQSWSDSAIDSSKFQHPDNHKNPPMLYEPNNFVGTPITLGAFTLSDLVLEQVDWYQPLSVSTSDVNRIPNETRQHGNKTITMYGNVGFYFGNQTSPAIGDTRVTFSVVPTSPVSIIAKQSSNTLTRYVAKNGKTVVLVKQGILPITEMILDAKQDINSRTWLIRLCGFAGMWLGMQLMVTKLAALVDFISFGGNLVGGSSFVLTFVLSLLMLVFVLALAWLFYRPLFSIPILAGITGLIGYGYWTKHRVPRPQTPLAYAIHTYGATDYDSEE